MFWSWRHRYSGGKVGARCQPVDQCVAMCSTYPICNTASNDSSSEPVASNRSQGRIPSIFDLDVGDTNWVITSSFIIFTMQTGDKPYKTAANCVTGVFLWQLAVVGDILGKFSSVSSVLPNPRSHNTGLLLELTSWLHKTKSFMRTNISSACQENFQILWDLKVHRLFYNSRSLVPVLRYSNPAHNIPSYPISQKHILQSSSHLHSQVVS